MRCIFCLKEHASSIEHIFPRAIGGRLTIDRVCRLCNSTLGSRVDAALSDSFLVRSRRADLRLAGNSGETPTIHELLLGDHELTDHPGMRVKVTFNKATGKLDLKLLHYASDLAMQDGRKYRQIFMDERDIGQIPKIIQRERQRHGVPPLSQEQLAAATQEVKSQAKTIASPLITINRQFNFEYVRHTIIKIAYELAFLWLGDPFLDDPSADEMRTAICTPNPNSTDRLPAWVGPNEDFDGFKLWSDEKDHHIAFMFVSEDGIAIGVRIFDVHAAFVWVTKDSARYLTQSDADAKVRFLAFDPVSGQTRHTSLTEEFMRIARRIVSVAQHVT